MKGRSANPYRKLAVGLLAATGVVGMTARAIRPVPVQAPRTSRSSGLFCSGAIWRAHRARRLSCSSRT